MVVGQSSHSRICFCPFENRVFIKADGGIGKPQKDRAGKKVPMVPLISR